MKILLYLITSFISIALSSAKITSSVEVTNIQSIAIKQNKITIIGDAMFQSRMVTTKAKRDSDFVISGQPSMSYVAHGNAVTFIITPHKTNIANFDQLSDKDKEEWSRRKKVFKIMWKDNIAAAKKLKKGDQTSLSIEGSDVRFNNGKLELVKGNGLILTQNHKKHNKG